jgi:predicted small integral membrane protein
MSMLEAIVLLCVTLAVAGLFTWVATRPTVTPKEQENLIRFGHK